MKQPTKQYSTKKSVQLLAHVLQGCGITDFVISPGSRNAALAIHFSQIEDFRCYSIVDERSAAFVALGMAKKLGRPVGVICTSGSAAANYYPAVTEAFYANVPILLLTADRPADFVDLFDGQTIRQKNLFHQHSYGDFELNEDETEEAERENFNLITTAASLCWQRQGPVHLNIPLAEPLYDFTEVLPVMPRAEVPLNPKKYQIPASLVAQWNTAKRILILAGTLSPNPELNGLLAQLVKNHSVVVLAEAQSNLAGAKIFGHTDRYIFGFEEEDFRTYAPDLLITIGQNVVSKKVKQFLRRASAKKHWHIDPHWHPDTYFSLSEKIAARPEVFFQQLLPQILLEPQPYFNLWQTLREKADRRHREYLAQTPFSDLEVFHRFAETLPADYAVHFSNSAPIRYAQLFDFGQNPVFCNRGTSGIDGSTSTAMGYALANENPTVLMAGDIGFFYDINGLWNQYIPASTRIIVVNNGGGDIFKIIPGPARAPEPLRKFIATEHRHSVELMAENFGFEYEKATDSASLKEKLGNFYAPSERPKILEVQTWNEPNAEILKAYFRFVAGAEKEDFKGFSTN